MTTIVARPVELVNFDTHSTSSASNAAVKAEQDSQRV